MATKADKSVRADAVNAPTDSFFRRSASTIILITTLVLIGGGTMAGDVQNQSGPEIQVSLPLYYNYPKALGELVEAIESIPEIKQWIEPGE